MKFELCCFDGTGDFGSWRKKMKALLVQHKLQKALEEPSTQASSSSSPDADKELQEFAYSIIILYLVDNVLRQIDGEDTPYKV